ncbi:MAG: matrixin family metalloprotease [Reyranella sp.]|nr:matrixin family metalloprotease [Reyranella sp.]MBL6650522.1 matrixin family metalloprotease [Reyranella sp.]
MRTTRFVTTLVASGLLLLVAAIALSLMNAAAAAPGGPTYDTSAYHYTERPSAAAATSRVVAVYVDTDFGPAERERIGFALQQWNHVLNGFVRLHPVLLDSADRDLGRLRRPGWIVAKVDSRHPLARDRSAMAVTVGNRGGGFVYVIADRFPARDLTAVVLHEIGHVLGAGHDPYGHLMAPVYDRNNAHCIDRGAVAMVAQAQRLPLERLNWCIGPGLENGRVSAR